MRSKGATDGPAGLAAVWEAGPVGGLSDGALLDRFLDRDGMASELAVAALVERHAAMVWRVCRTSVGNDADAADAFQATFLVLLRRAAGIRRRESVAGWLGGVARRVAAHARVDAARRRAREEAAAGRADRSAAGGPAPDAAELVAIVRDELARLPARDRDVVLACDLDGLTETEAARRLDCPVGTVRSRLHRARARLRRRLAGRGLDPTAASGLLTTAAIDKLPAGLVAGTLALAARGGAGAAGGAPVGPVAVVLLVQQAGKVSSMYPILATSMILAGLIGWAAVTVPGAARPGPIPGRGVEAPPPTPQPGRPPVAPGPASPAALQPTLAAADAAPAADLMGRFRSIVAEYDAAWDRAEEASKAGKTQYEQAQIRVPLRPDEPAYARRMIELALVDPASRAARDAAIWVMDKTWMGDNGGFMGEYEAAANLLVAFHADDPEAVRLGLQLDHIITRRRDAFIEGCYAGAAGHEAKGLARMAYAQYLERKAPMARAAHRHPGRSEIRWEQHDEAGKSITMAEREGNLDFAYMIALRWLDGDKLRDESLRLYREVIADYAEVPYITRHHRRLEAKLAVPLQPDASADAKLDRAAIEAAVRRPPTLADVARKRLYAMTDLVPGRPAPAIEGVDVATGRPFRLADLRGRAVLILPWSDEYREFAELVKAREARERAQGRPFAVVGVVLAADRAAAGRAVEQLQVPWPNAFVASDADNDVEPITRAYQFGNVARAVLIDREGNIRDTQVSKLDCDAAIDRVLAPVDAPGPR